MQTHKPTNNPAKFCFFMTAFLKIFRRVIMGKSPKTGWGHCPRKITPVTKHARVSHPSKRWANLRVCHESQHEFATVFINFFSENRFAPHRYKNQAAEVIALPAACYHPPLFYAIQRPSILATMNIKIAPPNPPPNSKYNSAYPAAPNIGIIAIIAISFPSMPMSISIFTVAT